MAEGLGGVKTGIAATMQAMEAQQVVRNGQQSSQQQQVVNKQALERVAEMQRIEAAKAVGSSLGTNVNTFAWEIFSLEKSFFRKRLFSFYLIL